MLRPCKVTPIGSVCCWSHSRRSHAWRTRCLGTRSDPPRELVLDIDSTDDPTHGQQELSFFNGHYDEHMFHPLLVFTDGYLLGARLRPGNVGGATHLRPL